MKTIQDADSELSGAALLAVRYLAKDQAEFQSPEIAEQAWKIAENSSANELSRISAIQVASMLDSSKGDGSKYVTLAQAGNSMPIRLSAIAALGNSGDQTQREHLTKIVETEKEPLKTAAKHALQNLNIVGENKK